MKYVEKQYLRYQMNRTGSLRRKVMVADRTYEKISKILNPRVRHLTFPSENKYNLNRR